MTPLLQELDALVTRAEQAALQINGEALDESVGKIDAFMANLDQKNLAATELAELKLRMQRYLGICRFAGETIHDALMTATANMDRESVRYRESGEIKEARTPALMKRYG